jgi:hypothetical protein
MESKCYTFSVPLSYLDQNALIELGRKSRALDFRKKLDKAIGSGRLTIVVSVLHLIEAANTSKARNAIALADFIDSLDALWLRRDTRTIDVCESFYRFAKVHYCAPARVTDRATALAGNDVTARDFVERLMDQPSHLEPLTAPIKNSLDALTALRKRRVMPDEIRRANENLARAYMPLRTPEGLEFGPKIKAEYLSQVDVGSIPALAIECAISDNEILQHHYADRNTLIDKFHLIYALPCVDEIVSKDKFFKRIYPMAKRTGQVRAVLVCNEEFFDRL